MIRYSIILIIAFLISTAGVLTSQNILVLEKAGAGKKHLFQVRNNISLKTESSQKRIKGTITQILDSSIVINYSQEIQITDIAAIYRKRWGFSLLQNVLIAGGVLYTTLSLLNGTINNDDPLVPSKTLKIGGGMILAGILLTPLNTRKHPIEMTRWKLKILDFTTD